MEVFSIIIVGFFLANLPRMVSASYCGSELGDMEVYAPYSYYGSEAGNDLGHDTLNDSVWGLNSTAVSFENNTFDKVIISL